MIHIKTALDIEQMKGAGSLAKAALRLAGTMAKPGVTTQEIDKAVEEFLLSHKARPTFKGYHSYPASICASVNEQVVHGIPSETHVLQEGDILSVDTGATFEGWVGDNAWTFFVGEVADKYKALCECARDCLKAGILAAHIGNSVGDIGYAIQNLAQSAGYGVVRDYTGHGVGHVMHEDPAVPNYGKPGQGVKLRAGMVIAIEPMITLGDHSVRVMPNAWTVQTKDKSYAAHFEQTVAITEDGPLILTQDELGPWCSLQGGKL